MSSQREREMLIVIVLGARVSVCGQRHDQPGDSIYVLDYPTESNEQGGYRQWRTMRDPETGRHLVRSPLGTLPPFLPPKST